MNCRRVELSPSKPHAGIWRRRGIASLLAMLFLVLFSTLAIGFYAACTMSAQVASNDVALSRADAAADGGMQFIRYQLGSMTVPGGTSQSNLLSAVATQLAAQMNGSSNMNGHTVANSNGTVWIPASNDWTTLDTITGSRFRVAITQSGVNVVVTVTGGTSTASIKKGIQLQYQQAQKAGTIFNFGIASNGPLVASNTVTVTGATDPTKGSVLITSTSATPLNNSANGTSFSGDLSYTNSGGVNHYGNITIDGYAPSNPNFAQHVHSGVTPPQYPTVDSSVFLPYCTNTYSGSQSASNPPAFVNTILPANGNYNFSGSVSIQGVLYIMQPNKVSFSGPVNIQGCIVVDTTNGPSGSSATNSIKFSQTVTATSISSLPNNASFPAGERALTGSVILAPNFAVTATNSFGTVSGSMVAGQFTFTNNFTATVDGSIIQLDDVPMSFTNTANVTIASTGTSYFPAGLTFGTKYTPLPGTYIETVPQ